MKLGQVNNNPAVQRPVVKAERTEVAAENTQVDRVEQSDQGSDAANFTKMGLTGAGFIAALPLAYTGAVGGALLGGALGVGVAPLTGALAHGGFISGLGAAWGMLSGLGKWGMILGTATGLAGACVVGKSLGNGVGRLMGIPKDTSKHHVNLKNPVTFGAGMVLTTVGGVGGALGGFSLVGGATAAGTLLQGVIQHGFTSAALTNVASNALMAGGIAAAVAGAGGFMGGACLTKKLGSGVDLATNAVSSAIHGKKEEHKPELIAVSDGPVTIGPNGATVVLHKPEAKA